MATKAELLDIAKQAMDEGDEATAQAVMDDIERMSLSPKNERTFDVASSIGGKALDALSNNNMVGAIETGAQMGSGLINSAMSGVSAIGGGVNELGRQVLSDQPMDKQAIFNAASQAQQSTSEAIPTYSPQTQIGKGMSEMIGSAMESKYNPLNIARTVNQATGSSDSLAESGFPAAATALDVGGDLLAGAGIGKLAKVGVEAAQARRGAQAAQDIPQANTGSIPEQIFREPPKETGADTSQLPGSRPDEMRVTTLADSFADAGMKDRINSIASDIKLNPERVKAAELLGVDAPVATLSDDAALHAVSGALAASPGSKARAILIDYNKELTNRAQDLIKSAGGELDKGMVSSQLQDRMEAAITAIKNQSSDIYSQIDEVVPKDTIVNAKPLIRELNRRGSNSQRGIEGLSKPEQDVYRAVQGKPTYFDIDNIRKDIGESLGGRRGTYADANEATLKDLYGKLSNLQEGVADAISKTSASQGAGDLWRSAKALDVQRFNLQDHSKFLFGKDLNSAVMPKVELGLKQLAKGDPKKFAETVGSIPEDLRQRVIVSGLNGLLTKTMQGERAFNPAQFNAWYGELKSSPANTRILHRYLPEGAGERLDAMFQLSKGLQNVTNSIKETGIVNDAFKNFDKTGGLIDRLYATADNVAKVPVVGTAVGAPAVRIASGMLKMASKTRTPAITAADDLLADPTFKSAILDYQKSGKMDSATQKKLKASASYKKYLGSQDDARRLLIEKNGLVPFLLVGEADDK